MRGEESDVKSAWWDHESSKTAVSGLNPTLCAIIEPQLCSRDATTACTVHRKPAEWII